MSNKSEKKFRFTDERLSKLKPQDGKARTYVYDTKATGLRLQITAKGVFTFQFQARSKRLNKVLTKSLGHYPAMSISEAQEKADLLRTDINAGIDIEETARAVRNEDTFAEVFQRFMAEHSRPHKRTAHEDESRYTLYMEKPLGGKVISWFTTERVRKWHRDITKQPKQRSEGTVSPTTANHVLKLLSVVFNTMCPGQTNPCEGVKKFIEISRDRFLKPEELGRFFDALNHPDTPELFRDYALISLYTGGRRDNILSMKWKDVDLVSMTWTIPARESKNGRSMIIPLTGEALDILARRKKGASSIFVFPTPNKEDGRPLSDTGHYVEPKRAWQSVCKRAGLEDVKLHDLRRTLGSYMAMSGANTVAIGKALGHQSVQATAIYARLSTDPVRDGMQAAIDRMQQAASAGLKIVPIRKAEGE